MRPASQVARLRLVVVLIAPAIGSRPRLTRKSSTASLSPSVASTEQCIFAGGRPPSSSATCCLVIPTASVSVIPFAISVTIDDVAMAAPHPSVWNLMSSMWSVSSTLIVIFMTSPQTGLPTSPTPSASSITPTLRGSLKCSMTFSE
jgi:hypothetical protein